VQRFDEISDAELERRVELASRAARRRRSVPVEARAAGLQAAARILDAERDGLARIIVEEMGKPIRAARAEVEKCARTCRYYAEHGPRMLDDEPLSSDATEAYVRYLPIGVVVAVMPWNFPFWQVFRFAAPAMLAGNVGLLKHAHNVPRCALAIEDVLQRAGFDDGAFQTLIIGTQRVRGLIDDPRVAGVTLTGSEGAGVKVGEAAGHALKPCVLELGGSDPFVIMPSANMARAAHIAATAKNLNTGQSCIAAKRFIVHQSVADEFTRRFVDEVRQLRMGDPMREDTDVGPLATRQVRDDVDNQVRRTAERGARPLCGGRRGEGRGFFYEPTVLVDVPLDSPAATEGVFGPAAPVFTVKDIDEAIALANRTPFGLGSSVWTRDKDEERRFVDGIDAGQTFVNAMVASDPRLPFGGVKRSGFGRELAAVGMREFMNAKTIVVERGVAKRAESE
jgi:succinate-semialdehyde dehydrogenase/glutarate-semialdehyde dehydrogenase